MSEKVLKKAASNKNEHNRNKNEQAGVFRSANFEHESYMHIGMIIQNKNIERRGKYPARMWRPSWFM